MNAPVAYFWNPRTDPTEVVIVCVACKHPKKARSFGREDFGYWARRCHKCHKPLHVVAEVPRSELVEHVARDCRMSQDEIRIDHLYSEGHEAS